MIIVYGFEEHINKCIPCVSAKRLLDNRGIEYKFISVAPTKDESGPVLDESIIDELEVKCGTRRLSMPQIFKDDVRIGWFIELKKYLASNK